MSHARQKGTDSAAIGVLEKKMSWVLESIINF